MASRDCRSVFRVVELVVQTVVVEQVGGHQGQTAAAVAVEAVGTFLGAKQFVTSHFIFGKLFLATQITVEFAICRNQTSHKLRDGALDINKGDFAAAEGLLEQLWIVVGFLQIFDYLIGIGIDFHGACDRCQDHIFQSGNATIPAQACVVPSQIDQRHNGMVQASRTAKIEIVPLMVA